MCTILKLSQKYIDGLVQERRDSIANARYIPSYSSIFNNNGPIYNTTSVIFIDLSSLALNGIWYVLQPITLFTY